MFKQLAVSAVVASVALTATSARAGFIAFLTSVSTDTYNYTLRFTPEITAPAVGQEQLKSGDLVTLYDVVPSLSNLGVLPVLANFAITPQAIQPAGLTPPNLVGAAGIVDNSTAINLTFQYTGVTPITVLTNFSVTVKTVGGFAGTHVGTGVGDTFVDFGSGYTGEKDDLYPVILPQNLNSGGPGTPEPATLAMLSIGGVALLARRRRVAGR
jgi:hypothetical protein